MKFMKVGFLCETPAVVGVVGVTLLLLMDKIVYTVMSVTNFSITSPEQRKLVLPDIPYQDDFSDTST